MSAELLERANAADGTAPSSFLSDVNILDPEIYRSGIPHAQFTRLRREAPVYWHGEPNGRGFWVISRYADVVQISKDPYTFSSARGGTNIEDFEPQRLEVIQTLLVNMDPPVHNKFRKLVSRGFTPRMVNRLEQGIRDTVATLVDNVIGKGECDFVEAFSAPLPLQVIADMLGVPPEDYPKVFDWSNRMIGFDDPEFQSSVEDGTLAAMELWQYGHHMVATRAQAGPETLVNVLLDSELDGEALTEAEFNAFLLLLSVAGNETTRNLISGGMLALLEHPQQLERLRKTPELLPSAVEEMLRWVTPVIHFRRTATRDVELRGQHIRENDKVVMFYCSTNRDEEIFSDGQCFDISRSPNEHLSFGIGEHFCLGANLARLEIRLMFEELLRRVPEIQLGGPVRRLRSNFIAGIKSMPVRFPQGVSARA